MSYHIYFIYVIHTYIHHIIYIYRIIPYRFIYHVIPNHKPYNIYHIVYFIYQVSHHTGSYISHRFYHIIYHIYRIIHHIILYTIYHTIPHHITSVPSTSKQQRAVLRYSLGLLFYLRVMANLIPTTGTCGRHLSPVDACHCVRTVCLYKY
jgi:hypothetical protein